MTDPNLPAAPPVAPAAPPAAPADGAPPAPIVTIPAAPAAPAEPPVPFNSFLDENGLFTEGWKDVLVPEDMRTREVYNRFNDLPGLMKQLGHLDLVMKRQGKGIMPLSEDATPTEREMYYEALGRPKSPDDYAKFEAPEGLEEYYDETVLKEVREALHGAGLTQGQLDVVMALDARRLSEGIKQNEEADEAERKAAEDTLRTKWGTAYEERIALANQMVANNVSAEDEEKLLIAIGNQPLVIDFLANIAKKFSEGKLISPEAVATGAMTPAEAKLKMNELIAERARQPNIKWEDPAKYERINKEIERYAAMSLAGQG